MIILAVLLVALVIGAAHLMRQAIKEGDVRHAALNGFTIGLCIPQILLCLK